MDPQQITEELEHPGARNLLDSATLLRLAYNGSDGFPRVIPIGFYWNGNQIVVCTAATAPKVKALSSRPNVAITIEDRGLTPMRIDLAITRADGRTERMRIPASVWMQGARTHVVRVARAPEITRVEIDPDGLFPDMDRSNQLWTTVRGMRAHD